MKKILVIDDNAANQDAARGLADADHEVTVIGSYDEACKAFILDPLLNKGTRFDIVFLDLLMPCPCDSAWLSSSEQEFDGQEMPFGFSLLFLAVLSGAKHVAVVTDRNHHLHPMVASLDKVDPPYNKKQFQLNGAVVRFFQHPKNTTDFWKQLLEKLLSSEPPQNSPE